MKQFSTPLSAIFDLSLIKVSEDEGFILSVGPFTMRLPKKIAQTIARFILFDELPDEPDEPSPPPEPVPEPADPETPAEGAPE